MRLFVTSAAFLLWAASTDASAQSLASALPNAGSQTPQSGGSGTSNLTPGQGTDGCATPDFIAGPGPHPFDNTGSTTGVEGQANALCFLFGTDDITNDVWFTWSSPSTGPVTLSLCAGTADALDTKVAVYDGSGCPTAAALACSDDDCGPGFNSMLTFPAVRGNAYTIQLGNFPSAAPGMGSFTLATAPQADACTLDDGTAEIAYTLSGAAGEELIWINRFGAPGTVSTVNSITASWGFTGGATVGSPNGTPSKFAIWGYGTTGNNPGSATLLDLINVTVQNVDTDIPISAAFSTPVVVNGVYWVGVGIVTPGGPQNNAPLDRSTSAPGLAWAVGQVGGLANYNNLAANNFPPLDMATFDPGVWLVRANCSSEAKITVMCEPGVNAIACPCANPPSGAGRGCDNHGQFTGGASMTGSGTASLSNDTLSLTASGENNTSLTVFFEGETDISPGVPHGPFGAGVRCASDLERLYTGNAAGGTITRGFPGPTVSSVSSPISAGEYRYYFTIYRDPNAASVANCNNSTATINLTNMIRVLWSL